MKKLDQSADQPPEQTAADFFAGANTVARMDAYALSGGIPHVSGGEDTYFGMRLAKLGKVAFLPTTLRTLFRGSKRTDPAAGYGWSVVRAQERRTQVVPVSESLDYLLAAKTCTQAVETRQPFTDFAAAQPQLSLYVGQSLYEQMLALQVQAEDPAKDPEAAQALIRLIRLDLRQALVTHFPDEPLNQLADKAEVHVRTLLVDHWPELATQYAKALHNHNETHQLFFKLFAGVEVLQASLDDSQRQLLREPLTVETAAILAPVVLAWWRQHAEYYGHKLEDVDHIYAQGNKHFVGAYLHTVWNILESQQHDHTAALTEYALRVQEPDLLPASVISTSAARIEALNSSVRWLARNLRSTAKK